MLSHKTWQMILKKKEVNNKKQKNTLVGVFCLTKKCLAYNIQETLLGAFSCVIPRNEDTALISLVESSFLEVVHILLQQTRMVARS